MIVNTGGKDVVVGQSNSQRTRMSIGPTCYYWRTNTETISKDLQVTPDKPTCTVNSTNITVQGTPRNFHQASD